MRKSEIKVLVVEDDSTFGPALKESLKRQGYQVTLVQQPTEAARQMTLNQFHLLIVDCMLPKINGVDFAQRAKQSHAYEFQIIFMSGIFKHNNFASDAKSKTGAVEFFHKPFDIDVLMERVNDLFAAEIEPEKEPLHELTTTKEIHKEDLIRLFAKVDAIPGFELPLLFSYMLLGKISGALNLVDPEGQSSSIRFVNGKITEVNVLDKTSYFGILLVENGFTSAADVEDILSTPSDKPLGRRLVAAHALSPHAIHIALSQQMSIRLSKIVQNTIYKIKFQEEAGTETEANVGVREYLSLIKDTLDSKLDEDWLYRFYMTWLEHEVHIIDNKQRFDLVKDFYILRSAPEIFKFTNGANTFQDLLELSESSREDILKAFHFLVTAKLLRLSPSRKQRIDYRHKLNSLKAMAQQFQEKDYFQILGLPYEAKQKEIEKAYMELVKNLHPDRLETDAPAEVQKMTHKVFSFVTEAFEILRDEREREKYVKTIKYGTAEEALNADAKIFEGEELLKKGRYTEAYKIFRDLYNARVPRTDLPIYVVWALLKAPTPPEKTKKIVDKGIKLLKKVPPEERHSAKYLLAKALVYQRAGDYEKAKVNFKHAYTIDPTLNEARRELIKLSKGDYDESGFETTRIFSTIFKKRA